MTQDIIELVQRHVDTANSPEEETRLRELCEAEPLVREELESAMSVSRVLDLISGTEPSKSFRSNVMASLPDHPSWERTTRRQTAPLFSWPTKPVLTLAYGLVAGVVVTVAVMTSLVSPVSNTDLPGNASGTLVSLNQTLVSEAFDIGDDKTIDLEAKQIENNIVINLTGDLSSEMVITLSVENDGKIVLDSSFSPDPE